MKWFVRIAMIFTWVALLFAFMRTEKNESPERTLNVFAWGNCFSPESIEQFTKKTGIKVNLSHYASNEELLTKLSALEGKGYDLIVPSDYAVEILKQQKLIKKVDHLQVKRFAEIDTFLQGHKFDEDNTYSIPLQWDVLGVGYNKNLVKDDNFTPTLKQIFTDCGIKTAMTNDPVEAFNIAAFYLYGQNEKLSDEQVNNVARLLSNQKNWVEAYSSMRADYILATENVPYALAMTSYILDAAEHSSSIEFGLPKEGTFLSIESFAIPIGSKKDKEVYELINFLMQDKVLRDSADKYGSFPSIVQKDMQVQKEYDQARKTLEDENYPRLFVNHVIPESVVRSIWIKVKS